MYQAEHLDQQPRILDNAPVPADGLVGDIRVADLALVLDLDELDVSNEAKYFDYMSNDLVGWDCLDQLDLIVGLEVSHLISDLPNDLEVVATEHELHVDVDGDGDLADGVFYEQDHSFLQVGFEIDAVAVLDEESDLTLVISALQVNMTGHEVGATASRVVFKTLVDLQNHKNSIR